MMKVILLFTFFLFITALFSQVPDYEFITEPIEIIMNYFDYMPGSYCGIPVQIEDDGSAYIVFHARETAYSTRRVYFAYIDSWGNITNCETIGTEDIHEGYAGIDLDPATGDPIAAWHGNYDTQTADREVVCSYDLYHTGNLGLWCTPFIVINDTIQTPNGVDDEFIWPYVHIGPSPDPDKRRVYVIANNNFSPIGTPSENVLICYADFDEEDLTNQSTLDWTYNTIPLLDEWNQSIPEWIRPHLSMCVSDDGKVALMGYTTQDSIFVFLNENYGEGDYGYYSEFFALGVDNPIIAPWECLFMDGMGYCLELSFRFINSKNFNSIFTNESSQVRFVGNMCLYGESPNIELYFYNLSFPKEFIFNINDCSFDFFDLYPQGDDPSDDIPFIPWVQMPNGSWDYTPGWPIWYHVYENAFYENTFKIVKNEDKGWLAAVWHDGLKNKYAQNDSIAFIEWLEVPEIAISISADNGESWSEPIFLNSIETPELSEMIPVYIYPGDLIEDLGDDHGKLHLFFLDDYSYGSSIWGNGQNLGGMQMYASLDIDFGPFASTENEKLPQVSYELYNFPNPFNPTTTISYQLSADSKVSLSIYNIKGQKVKTLVNEVLPAGKYSTIWNGRDANGKPVSSGIYFYKLKTETYSKVKKMMLLK